MTSCFLLNVAFYCIHNGLRYALGDVIQPNCSTRCTCQQGGYFDCKAQRCFADGPTCYGWGDPHYGSFDSRTFDFQGDCEYILSQPCNSSEFIITGTNTAINSHVSVTSAVRIIVHSKGLEIYLTRGGSVAVTVNGVLQTNNRGKMVHHSTGVEVFKTGGHIIVLLEISFPVKVTWDGSHRVDITVSSRWQGKLCGLCGNYNNDASDDFMLPDGTITNLANEFGRSWLYANASSTCGLLQPALPCPANVMVAAQSRCNELMNDIFSVCNSVVNPASFIEGCMLDYCSCTEAEREECYCNSLSSYAAVCASKNVIIPSWRNFFCRK